MSFTPLSLSEVHRRRAARLDLFSSPQLVPVEGHRDENEEDEVMG